MPRARIIVTTLALLLIAGTAQAGWSEFWGRAQLDWHRMNCWPEPFVQADRQLVAAPFSAMLDNGWRLQNTLGDHLFRIETQQLTHAGRLKVHWIATQAPHHRRVIFVLRGAQPEITEMRVEAVQQTLLQIAPEGPPVEVLLTDVPPRGGAGDYFDQIDRKVRSSIPEPRLPAREPVNGSNSR